VTGVVLTGRIQAPRLVLLRLPSRGGEATRVLVGALQGNLGELVIARWRSRKRTLRIPRSARHVSMTRVLGASRRRVSSQMHARHACHLRSRSPARLAVRKRFSRVGLGKTSPNRVKARGWLRCRRAHSDQPSLIHGWLPSATRPPPPPEGSDRVGSRVERPSRTSADGVVLQGVAPQRSKDFRTPLPINANRGNGLAREKMRSSFQGQGSCVVLQLLEIGIRSRGISFTAHHGSFETWARVGEASRRKPKRRHLKRSVSGERRRTGG
jgi:hypothetical protein